MLGDEMPEMNCKGPQTLGGSPVGIMLYVEDADARFKQAIAAGGNRRLAPSKTSSTATDPVR